jgi:hypothetical protein
VAESMKAAGVKEENPIDMTNAALHTGANLHTEKTAGMNAAQTKLEKKPFTPASTSDSSTPDLKAQGPQTSRENKEQKTKQGNKQGNESS